ncbi:redoxin domain-containing protein [Haloferacaceae archaeon DSL9]
MLSPGQTAPDFICPGVSDGPGGVFELFSLVDEHRATLLYFYPADFVPPCTADLRALSAVGWVDDPAIAVVALSADSIYAHAAYAGQYDLSIPLLSDFHAGVAESYGVVHAEWQGHSHIPMRALFLLDGWTVAFADAVDDPLDERSPSPVEAVADELEAVVGRSVARPTVRYEDGI